MTGQLNYLLAQQRVAELHRAAEQQRLASVARVACPRASKQTAINRLAARCARWAGRGRSSELLVDASD
jgi:hypothetical protein